MNLMYVLIFYLYCFNLSQRDCNMYALTVNDLHCYVIY